MCFNTTRVRAVSDPVKLVIRKFALLESAILFYVPYL